ncbi:MAG: serine kinase [Candidatus Aminicenantes bacterium]|nr:serine kinase [Candidatus Aminicenantes bacterium]MBL7084075.1 serine kinase [Candidatus Aminicenantes bacterium]
MKLKEIIEKLQLKVLTGQDKLQVEVTGGYTSDLLSDVIANSKQGNLWITLQIHQNIIAVAKLKDLAGIIIVNNREPDEETLQKAKEENVPLFSSEEMAFEISGKLYELISS